MSPLHARKLHPRISKWFLSFQLGSILGRSSNDFEALRVENRRHDPSLPLSLFFFSSTREEVLVTGDRFESPREQPETNKIERPLPVYFQSVPFLSLLFLSFLLSSPLPRRLDGEHRIGKFKCDRSRDEEERASSARVREGEGSWARAYSRTRTCWDPPSVSLFSKAGEEACARL